VPVRAAERTLELDEGMPQLTGARGESPLRAAANRRGGPALHDAELELEGIHLETAGRST
jgi:hypothetical protein